LTEASACFFLCSSRQVCLKIVYEDILPLDFLGTPVPMFSCFSSVRHRVSRPVPIWLSLALALSLWCSMNHSGCESRSQVQPPHSPSCHPVFSCSMGLTSSKPFILKVNTRLG
jgi:hypothetical protein